MARRSFQRAVNYAIQEASRAEGGLDGRFFQSPATGERPFLAPASQLEGPAAFSMPARRSLPARITFPTPLFHTADSAADWTVLDSAGQHRTVSDTTGHENRTGPDMDTHGTVQNPPDMNGQLPDIPDIYRTVIPDSTGQCTGQRTGQQPDIPGHSPDNRTPRAQLNS